MKFIDKNIGAIQGTLISREYLDNHCKDANGHYSNVLYYSSNPATHPDFLHCGTPTYYDRMMSLLLQTQDNLCCYCLRRLRQDPLSDAKASLEHIVPQSFTDANQADFDDYQAASPFMSNVQLTDVFERQVGAQALPPYPHKVAYHNMVASCNGTFPDCRELGPDSQVCCNHGRQSDRVLPVYFWSDIEQLIEYTKDGGIYVKDGAHDTDVIEEVIKNTHLDHSALKDIRRVWYYLSACENLNEIKQCDTEEKRDQCLIAYFSELLTRNSREAHRLIEKFRKTDYWNTLMLYDAFYDIMRNA